MEFNATFNNISVMSGLKTVYKPFNIKHNVLLPSKLRVDCVQSITKYIHFIYSIIFNQNTSMAPEITRGSREPVSTTT